MYCGISESQTNRQETIRIDHISDERVAFDSWLVARRFDRTYGIGYFPFRKRIEKSHDDLALYTLPILQHYVRGIFHTVELSSKKEPVAFALPKNSDCSQPDPILVALIAERMQEIREQHNDTKEYVMHKTGLGISDYERKAKFPILTSISKFCKLYNMSFYILTVFYK